MWNDALPRQGITNWQTFYAAQSVTTANSWQSWTKPAGCSWIYIYCQASGGGGGRPPDGDGAGAGGGGSGGTTRMLLPAFTVPDILYVRPGEGGFGATTANTAGSTGISSFVSTAPSTASANILVSHVGGGGGAAVTTAGLAGGSASQGMPTLGVSLFNTIVGVAGSNGGSNGVDGVDITQTASSLTTGGTGGGGTGNRGGNIINGFVYPTITSSSGQDGRNGFQLGTILDPGLKSFPMIFSGGTGGAGGDGTGGGNRYNGGKGSYGGGGGGGGAGVSTGAGPTPRAAGNGGDGGDGFILIGAF